MQQICKSQQKLIVLLGPTASGKSSAGLALAEKIHAEIISGDSVCVYRGLDIGSAKPAQDELARVPQHLINILPPTAEYSAADFKAHAEALVAGLNARGTLPLLVGGTGLYIKALLEDYRFSGVAADPEYRAELETYAAEHGAAALHTRLARLCPQEAKRLSPNDLRRVVRALETLRGGEKVSRLAAGRPVYDAYVFGLRWERARLYERINARVDAMMRQGLLSEVRELLRAGVPAEALSMRSLGYRQLVQYLHGEFSLDDAVAEIKKQTRHFAKRQLTWYRKMPYVDWLDADGLEPEELAEEMLRRLAARKFCRAEEKSFSANGGARVDSVTSLV